jgi:RNA polymerase sigma-70 factor (ECF subfamily)
VNKAKRRGARESRSRPFADDNGDRAAADDRSIDPAYFFPRGHPGAGHWNFPLADEEQCPESHVLAEEAGQFILSKIDELPAHYRGVILLRDLHGLSADETCTMLGISANNQRVMLHRARTKLRIALEPYLRGNEHVPQISLGLRSLPPKRWYVKSLSSW